VLDHFLRLDKDRRDKKGQGEVGNNITQFDSPSNVTDIKGLYGIVRLIFGYEPKSVVRP